MAEPHILVAAAAVPVGLGIVSFAYWKMRKRQEEARKDEHERRKNPGGTLGPTKDDEPEEEEEQEPARRRGKNQLTAKKQEQERTTPGEAATSQGELALAAVTVDASRSDVAVTEEGDENAYGNAYGGSSDAAYGSELAKTTHAAGTGIIMSSDDREKRLEDEIAERQRDIIHKETLAAAREREYFEVGETQSQIDDAFAALWQDERWKKRRLEKKKSSKSKISADQKPAFIAAATSHRGTGQPEELVVEIPEIEEVQEGRAHLLVTLPEHEKVVKRPVQVVVTLPKVEELEDSAVELRVPIPKIEGGVGQSHPVAKPIELVVQIPQVQRWPLDLVVNLPMIPEITVENVETTIRLPRIKDVVLQATDVSVTLPKLHECLNQDVNLTVAIPAIPGSVEMPLDVMVKVPRVDARGRYLVGKEKFNRAKMQKLGKTQSKQRATRLSG